MFLVTFLFAFEFSSIYIYRKGLLIYISFFLICPMYICFINVFDIWNSYITLINFLHYDFYVYIILMKASPLHAYK